MTLTDKILAHALALGFDLAGVMPAGPPLRGAAFSDWLAAGYHGEMAYLAARAAERLNPALLAPGARSAILLAANYNPGPPPAGWDAPALGRFARYAWSADYHAVIKPRLCGLDAFIRGCTGRTTPGKACVDTAALLERDFASQAGLGFIGRNTCLIAPGLGSWTLLAALLVPEVLDVPDTPRSWTCGRCTRCLDACPTNALLSPYVLDARRCISYLTVELRGPIPRELRPLMGNWVFGCDVCQEVCPYNRRAAASAWPTLVPDPGRAALPLLELLALDEAGFRARFRGTAVWRAKRRGLVRNACVAAGNCLSWEAGQGEDRAVVLALTALLADPEPLVRGHAAWALGRIGGAPARQALALAAPAEPDAWVRDEMAWALTESVPPAAGPSPRGRRVCRS
jgi:epoxyqueuosine reductase